MLELSSTLAFFAYEDYLLRKTTTSSWASWLLKKESIVMHNLYKFENLMMQNCVIDSILVPFACKYWIAIF